MRGPQDRVENHCFRLRALPLNGYLTNRMEWRWAGSCRYGMRTPQCQWTADWSICPFNTFHWRRAMWWRATSSQSCHGWLPVSPEQGEWTGEDGFPAVRNMFIWNSGLQISHLVPNLDQKQSDLKGIRATKGKSIFLGFEIWFPAKPWFKFDVKPSQLVNTIEVVVIF